MEITAGSLTAAEWSAARALVHRAFADEPFTIQMFGEPPLQRWAGSWSLYSSLASDSYSVSLGARVGGVLVGVLIGSVAGRCHLCQVLAGEPPPVDPQLAIDWQFHQNIAAVHRRVPEHAWVAKVVSEPALQGQGIGRHLVGAALDLLRSDKPVDVVLECAPNRASFYERAGFEALTTFVDPAGPDAFLMHQQIPSRPSRQAAPTPSIAPERHGGAAGQAAPRSE